MSQYQPHSTFYHAPNQPSVTYPPPPLPPSNFSDHYKRTSSSSHPTYQFHSFPPPSCRPPPQPPHPSQPPLPPHPPPSHSFPPPPLPPHSYPPQPPPPPSPPYPSQPPPPLPHPSQPPLPPPHPSQPPPLPPSPPRPPHPSPPPPSYPSQLPPHNSHFLPFSSSPSHTTPSHITPSHPHHFTNDPTPHSFQHSHPPPSSLSSHSHPPPPPHPPPSFHSSISSPHPPPPRPPPPRPPSPQYHYSSSSPPTSNFRHTRFENTNYVYGSTHNPPRLHEERSHDTHSTGFQSLNNAPLTTHPRPYTPPRNEGPSCAQWDSANPANEQSTQGHPHWDSRGQQFRNTLEHLPQGSVSNLTGPPLPQEESYQHQWHQDERGQEGNFPHEISFQDDPQYSRNFDNGPQSPLYYNRSSSPSRDRPFDPPEEEQFEHEYEPQERNFGPPDPHYEESVEHHNFPPQAHHDNYRSEYPPRSNFQNDRSPRVNFRSKYCREDKRWNSPPPDFKQPPREDIHLHREQWSMDDRDRGRGSRDFHSSGPPRERGRDENCFGPPMERRDGDREFSEDRRPALLPTPERSGDGRGLPPPPPPLPPPQHFTQPEIRTVSAEEVFDLPGRNQRPSHVVVLLRGLPGAGKSHLAKLIREKEISQGAPAPRILSIDSYFLTEIEKTEKDPETGRRVKRKVQEYEYEADMEQAYRASLFKAYNKTLEEGFFPMVIVDATNHRVHHFDRYWSNGKMRGFEVFIVEMLETLDLCVQRNVHHRTREEIEKLAHEWEDTPPHFTRLDVTSLISDSNIDEVEMECTDSEEEKNDKVSESKEKTMLQDGLAKSRWEDASDERLDKLDAIGEFRRKKRLHSEIDDNEEEEDEEEELSLLEYLRTRNKTSLNRKKKRVRWADLEAKKEEQKKRELGFCIGGSWGQVSEDEARTLLLGGTKEKGEGGGRGGGGVGT